MNIRGPASRALSIAIAGLVLFCNAQSETLISVKEAVTTPQQPADYRLNYGPHVFQFGDLRLPSGAGPHPVIVVIHGGCWTTRYGLHLMDGMSERLTQQGYATWNIEFRRVGQYDSEWPDLFDDVSRATHFLRTLAKTHDLDLGRIVITGHSSGGHIALWLASRLQADWSSPAGRVLGAVALAPIVDLVSLAKSDGEACQESLAGLLGGTYEELPDRYAAESPINMDYNNVAQILVSGSLDTIVPTAHVVLHVKAQAGGDALLKHVISAASGHFEMITPGTETWTMVEKEIGQLIDSASSSTDE